MLVAKCSNPILAQVFGINLSLSDEGRTVNRAIAQTDATDHSMTFGDRRQRMFSELRKVCSQAPVANWDGYGALPVNEQSAAYAAEMIRMMDAVPEIPQISVDPDGEVAFEWDYGPRKVFSVSVGRDGTLTYAGLFGFSKTHGTEILSKSIPATIWANIERVTKRTSC